MEKRVVKDIMFFAFVGVLLAIALFFILHKPSDGLTANVIFNGEVNKESPQFNFEFTQEDISNAKDGIFNLMNAERHNKKIVDLNRNALLDAVAQQYSDRMITEGFFSHKDPAGKDVYDRLGKNAVFYWEATENLYSGEISENTPLSREVVNGWLANPALRGPIVDTNIPPTFSDVGIGLSCKRIDNSEEYTCYAVAIFAKIALVYENEFLESRKVDAVNLYPEDSGIDYPTKAVINFEASKSCKVVISSDPDDAKRLSADRQLNGEDIWTFNSEADFEKEFIVKPGYTFLIFAQNGDTNYNLSVRYNK